MNGEIICNKLKYENEKIDLVSKFIDELRKINWCDSAEELYENHHVKLDVKLDSDLDNDTFVLTIFDNPNSLGLSLYNMLLTIINSPSARLSLIAIGVTPITNKDLAALEIPIGTRPISVSVSYELMKTL